LITQSKARTRNRRSINSGGPIDVETARKKKGEKERKEKNEAIRKARKAIESDIRKSKNALNRRGVEARKAERERKRVLLELTAEEQFIPLELLVPIHDPEKNPTLADLESLQPHPSLVQALQELQPIPIDPKLLENSDTDEVELQLEKVEELVELVDDSSDGDSYISEDSNDSNDSITRNADFISLV
jgi:hypothetical protein